MRRFVWGLRASGKALLGARRRKGEGEAEIGDLYDGKIFVTTGKTIAQ